MYRKQQERSPLHSMGEGVIDEFEVIMDRQ